MSHIAYVTGHPWQMHALKADLESGRVDASQRAKLELTFEELITQLIVGFDMIEAQDNQDLRRKRKEQVIDRLVVPNPEGEHLLVLCCIRFASCTQSKHLAGSLTLSLLYLPSCPANGRTFSMAVCN